MLLFKDYKEIPDYLKPFVVTIGNFDGMHIGHRAILGHTIEKAKRLGLNSLVCSFWPHPGVILNGYEPGDFLLQDHETKNIMLAETGIDCLLQIPFDEHIMSMEAESFVSDVLVHELHTAHVTVGDGFRFGRGRQGDCATLERLGKQLGFSVSIMPIQGDNSPYSSSFIRKELAKGEVENATRILGRPYKMSGLVSYNTRKGWSHVTHVNSSKHTIRPGKGFYSINVTYPGTTSLKAACFCPDEGSLVLYTTKTLLTTQVEIEFLSKTEHLENCL